MLEEKLFKIDSRLKILTKFQDKSTQNKNNLVNYKLGKKVDKIEVLNDNLLEVNCKSDKFYFDYVIYA